MLQTGTLRTGCFANSRADDIQSVIKEELMISVSRGSRSSEIAQSRVQASGSRKVRDEDGE